MATAAPATLPAEADVVKAASLLQRGHDAHERLMLRIDGYLQDRKAPLPTLADLGVLWLLVEQLTMSANELTRMAETISTEMSGLDSLRIDGRRGGDDA